METVGYRSTIFNVSANRASQPGGPPATGGRRILYGIICKKGIDPLLFLLVLKIQDLDRGRGPGAFFNPRGSDNLLPLIFSKSIRTLQDCWGDSGIPCATIRVKIEFESDLISFQMGCI